ncbi:hypothetical protein [Mesorhizobium japonicum]|uniref:hypothetical protein n=1 Tax=Mesorhizobium japonicum TaxID=2066070 RepID=UPI0002D5B549|nr:hypothetical protein [Mesorhizobium japonicum]
MEARTGALYWGAVGEGRIWSAHLVQVFDSTRSARHVSALAAGFISLQSTRS